MCQHAGSACWAPNIHHQFSTYVSASTVLRKQLKVGLHIKGSVHVVVFLVQTCLPDCMQMSKVGSCSEVLQMIFSTLHVCVLRGASNGAECKCSRSQKNH